jgi:hypothetical protein
MRTPGCNSLAASLDVNARARNRVRRIVAASAVVLSVAATRSSAEWLVDADVGATYDSNLTGAPSAPDIRPDWAATINVGVGQFLALTGDDGLTLTVNARGESYDRYKGLNVAAIGAAAVCRHKFGVGWGAPWAALVVEGSYDDYRNDLRSGARFDVRAEVGRRFTEGLDAVAGVAYDRRYGPHGEPVVPGISGKVFDLSGYSAYFRIGYAIDDVWLLGVDGSIRRGDVESTSQRGLAVFLASSAIAADPAFNDPALFAYRLRGTTSTLGVSLSLALSDRSSLNLHYRYEFTDSPQELEYRSYNTGLAFAYRF